LFADIARSQLDDWLRERHFTARIDLSGAGVRNYSLRELRELLGITSDELDDVVFRDSPSQGGVILRQAIAARVAPGRFDVADRVMVTHGATEGILLALGTLVRPGDEIITLCPGRPSLRATARALGATVRQWELSEDDEFRPDPDRLRRMISGTTRAIVLDFPHNPTGVTLDQATVDQLLCLVERYDCHLVWDASSAELVFEGEPLPDPGATHDRCVSVGSLSNAYGLPGMRLGWCVAAPDLLRRMAALRDNVTVHNSPLIERLATAVLSRADDVLKPRLAQAHANRELLAAWAARNAEYLDCPLPSAGVTAFPAVPALADVTPMCVRLADQAGVLTVPGRRFGHPNRMRIGFGGPAEEFEAGLAALAQTARRWARSMLSSRA
jgi:capreomycidine synthase